MTHAQVFRAGVLGWPVSHSLSPRLHSFWLKQYNITGSYEAIPVRSADLAQALRSLKAQGFRGVNLTLPHKQKACALVDCLEASAKHIGAVNLVTVGQDGRLRGQNTDAYGFQENLLASGLIVTGGTGLILGAGGGARAVVVALMTMGFKEIRIANRTYAHAESLAKEFTTASCRIAPVDWDSAPLAQKDVSLLVNTTVLGMEGQPRLDYPLEGLPPDAAVTDIVYTPLRTDLLRRAHDRGHKTVDGLGMLLHQARPAFAAFFGPDPEITPELRRYVLEGKSSYDEP